MKNKIEKECIITKCPRECETITYNISRTEYLTQRLSHWVDLNIHFNDFNYQEIKQVPIMSANDLIGSIVGTLGVVIFLIGLQLII